MEFDAERFRSARIKSGLSQGEAARLIGVSVGGLRHWEHGDYGPRTLMLQQKVEEFVSSVETGEIGQGTIPEDRGWIAVRPVCERCGSDEYRYWGKGICWKCRQEDMTKDRAEREEGLTEIDRDGILGRLADGDTVRTIAREYRISAAKVRAIVSQAAETVAA